MSKFLDENGLLYLWSKVKAGLSGKVDKAEGKGLSANDFTAEEKSKLAALENYTLPEASAGTLGGVRVGDGLAISNGVLSAAVDWDRVGNKPDLALKSDLTSLYRFRGSVAGFAALPAENNTVGDVWNAEDSGMNYAWTGEGWDALGQALEIEGITNAEIDAIVSGE